MHIRFRGMKMQSLWSSSGSYQVQSPQLDYTEHMVSRKYHSQAVGSLFDVKTKTPKAAVIQQVSRRTTENPSV